MTHLAIFFSRDSRFIGRHRLYQRYERLIKGIHPLFAEPHQCTPQQISIGNKGCHINPEARIGHPAQVLDSAFKEADRATMVAITPVMQGNGNLQSPLQEVSDLPGLTKPQIFKCFMAIVPITAIELSDGQQKLARWRLLTCAHDQTPLKRSTIPLQNGAYCNAITVSISRMLVNYFYVQQILIWHRTWYS